MKTQIDNYLTSLDTLNIKEDKDIYVERLENAYREHITKIDLLEKALDKAIDELIEADGYILCGWNKARYKKDRKFLESLENSE